MIKISVVSYNNEEPGSPRFAVFDGEGRTMGRSRDNHFVLEDPKNLVSRAQARVTSEGARHVITNLSRATALVVNGREIEPDREHELNPGDEIQVGLYVLRADPVIAAHPLPRLEPKPVGPAAADSIPVPAEHQALIQAFLKGAGIPSITLAYGLTPEFMETVGRLLAVSVQGTMDLNAFRATVKREAKADVTQVVHRNNNPLKFLPDGETVLMQMFRKRMPGFMSPTEAMEDAYDDLRSHQSALMAGIRAAVAELLQRMHPDHLEEKCKDGSLLDSIRIVNRKGRLWDCYVGLHAQISAEDELQALFGTAFLAAYEQEIERMSEEARQRKSHAESA